MSDTGGDPQGEKRYGGSSIDRRKHRPDGVHADEHYRLSRRVDDLRGRVDSIERLVVELSHAQADLRDRLMDIAAETAKRVDDVYRWTQRQRERMWLQAIQTVTNFIVIAVVLAWFLTR